MSAAALKRSAKERETERDRRNLDPHQYAVAAMWLFGNDYMNQNGGSMDFWDSLPAAKKAVCRDFVGKVLAARKTR